MCFHKYGKIEQDGHQYCIRCGKAVHQCKWKFVKEFQTYNSSSVSQGQLPTSISRIYECEICGEMKEEFI